jgi:TonB family protein
MKNPVNPLILLILVQTMAIISCTTTAAKTAPLAEQPKAEPIAIWNGTADTAWYNDTATEFTITTAEQLAGFAKLVNSDNDFNGKTVALGRNIMLNDTTNWQDWKNNPPANEWVPIGGKSSPFSETFDGFSGTFDGSDFVVSGIYINNDKKNHKGLFGEVKEGTIENLGVVASYIKGKGVVGGIVGNNGGVISNSYSTADVAGLFVGVLAGENRGTIINSYSIGTAEGVYAGGLAGNNYWKIRNCYSASKVTGGVVGGLSGSHGFDTSCGGNETSSYYDKEANGQIEDVGSKKKCNAYDGGRTTAEMQSKEFVDSLNFNAALYSKNVWVHSAGKYPSLSNKVVKIEIGSFFASGKGTEAEPYIISTKKQLEDFARLVNERISFSDEYIKLGANIMLNDTANWQNWANNPPANEWTGNRQPFNGNFDGNGHVISGVYVNYSPFGGGLFSEVYKEGVIKNLGITASYIVGGLIKSNFGIVNNCYFIGSVAKISSIGGFIGENYGGVISNSYLVDTENGGNCYYNKSDKGKCVGKAMEEMQSKEFADNLNFRAGLVSTNAWIYSPGKYPALSGKAAETKIDPFFAGGKGTEIDPYIITTKKQLENFSLIVNSGMNFAKKYLKLVANIALNDTANWQNWANKPPVNAWASIGTEIDSFDGNFDGNGYVISGIYINSESDAQGLFGVIGEGTVKNIGVITSYIKGESCVGGLAGENENGVISNSYFAGIVNGRTDVGGLVGLMTGWGKRRVISNSYSAGQVIGKHRIGGLVGFIGGSASTTISNSYSVSKISGMVEDFGGLAGWLTNDAKVIDSYYDNHIDKLPDKGFGSKGEGKSVTGMKQKSTYKGWDFDNVWGISGEVNGGYPHLLLFNADSSKVARSKEEIMQVVNTNMSSLRKIYNKYLEQKPGFGGKIIIKFTINPSGDIISINIVSSETGYPDFDNAIKDAIITWKWKAIKSGNTTPTIPFNFSE